MFKPTSLNSKLTSKLIGASSGGKRGGVSGFVTNSQQFEIDLPVSTSTDTAAISSSPLNTSLVFFHGNRVGTLDTDASRNYALIEPVDATTMRATRGSSAGIATLGAGSIITGTSNLFDLVEYSNVVITGTTDTETLTNTFDLSRSFVSYLGHSSSSSSAAVLNANVRLTGTSQLTFDRTDGATSTNMSVVTAQLNADAVESVEQIVDGFFSVNVTLSTSVDPDNTLCFWNNQIIDPGSSGANLNFMYGFLNNSTTFSYNATLVRNARVTVVAFADGVMSQAVQREQTTIATGTSQTSETILPIKKNRAALNRIGFSTNDTSLAPSALAYDNFLPTVEFAQVGGDATVYDTVIVKRGTSATETVTVSWEAADFN